MFQIGRYKIIRLVILWRNGMSQWIKIEFKSSDSKPIRNYGGKVNNKCHKLFSWVLFNISLLCSYINYFKKNPQNSCHLPTEILPRTSNPNKLPKLLVIFNNKYSINSQMEIYMTLKTIFKNKTIKTDFAKLPISRS